MNICRDFITTLEEPHKWLSFRCLQNTRLCWIDPSVSIFVTASVPLTWRGVGDGARQGPAFSQRGHLFDATGSKDGAASLYHIDRGGWLSKAPGRASCASLGCPFNTVSPSTILLLSLVFCCTLFDRRKKEKKMLFEREHYWSKWVDAYDLFDETCPCAFRYLTRALGRRQAKLAHVVYYT
jgi:hypothetical protein